MTDSKASIFMMIAEGLQEKICQSDPLLTGI